MTPFMKLMSEQLNLSDLYMHEDFNCSDDLKPRFY